MPFGPLLQPSLGLGLLAASLGQRTVRSEYFTLPFGDLLGAELYQWIAIEAPSEWLVGDWIFGAALHDEPPGSDQEQAYVENVLRADRLRGHADEARIEQLLDARNQATDFAERCARKIISHAPRIVGFSSIFAQHTASLAVARRVKEALPQCPILFGGANCEGVMGRELLNRFEWVDLVVSGEGDRVFPELVDRLLDGRPVHDLAGVHDLGQLRKLDDPESPDQQVPANAPSVTHMDALPFPDYEPFFEQWAASATSREQRPVLLFETSRGCWWGSHSHCTFCGLNASTMSFRSKSWQRVLDELGHFADSHPDLFMMSVDNILDFRYFNDLLPELARSDLQLDLFFALKANLKKDQLRVLRDAGVRNIQPGIESLSDPVLRLMRKGETALQNIEVLKWCRELGLSPAWNFIWGFPTEPIDDYRHMTEWVPWLTHLTPPQTAKSIRLDRYSPNFDLAAEFGFTNVRPAAAYGYVYPFGEPSLHRLAYHFDFDYGDDRDVGRYTAALAEQIEVWTQEHSGSSLIWAERGQEVWIWDLRPAAVATLTVLRDLDRDLYLACDAARTEKRLCQEFEISAVQLETHLRPLEDRGLILRQGGKVLSLAIAPGAEGDQPTTASPAPASESAV